MPAAPPKAIPEAISESYDYNSHSVGRQGGLGVWLEGFRV